MELVVLFLVFMKIGLISFGGGYAMIPFLQSEVVSRGWLTNDAIIDMVGMSQITPGPVATNMATFVGYNQYGVVGAFVATLGVALPPFILVLLVTKYVINKLDEKTRKSLFLGLQPVVISLILVSCLSLGKSIFFYSDFSKIDFISIAISAVSFILLIKYKVSPIKLIIASAIVGMFLY